MSVDALGDTPELWRLVVVGGYTRNIGKTQLVCDVIQAFPKVDWIAGKISELEGAPGEHVCALDWETSEATGTDSARFLKAGAKRSFWLRSKPGSLAECKPTLLQALREARSELTKGDGRRKALIFESNSLMQLVKPSLYLAVIDPDKEDFTESALAALERANALVLHPSAVRSDAPPAPLWMKIPAKLLQQRPSVLQRIGEPLPRPLESLIYQMLDDPPTVSFQTMS